MRWTMLQIGCLSLIFSSAFVQGSTIPTETIAAVAEGWKDCPDSLFETASTDVVIALLSDSLRSCLVVIDEHISRPVAGNQSCVSTMKWTDGTNGCDAYRRNKGFCEQYGGTEFRKGHGVANNHCCACGGGRPLRFSAGDQVEVKLNTRVDSWQKATVAQVAYSEVKGKRWSPSDGPATNVVAEYLVTLDQLDARQRQFPPQQQQRLRLLKHKVPGGDGGEGFVRLRMPDPPLALRLCALASQAEKTFRVVPVGGPSSSASSSASADWLSSSEAGEAASAAAGEARFSWHEQREKKTGGGGAATSEAAMNKDNKFFPLTQAHEGRSSEEATAGGQKHGGRFVELVHAATGLRVGSLPHRVLLDVASQEHGQGDDHGSSSGSSSSSSSSGGGGGRGSSSSPKDRGSLGAAAVNGGGYYGGTSTLLSRHPSHRVASNSSSNTQSGSSSSSSSSRRNGDAASDASLPGAGNSWPESSSPLVLTRASLKHRLYILSLAHPAVRDALNAHSQMPEAEESSQRGGKGNASAAGAPSSSKTAAGTQAYEPLCLLGGEFGEPRMDAPQWRSCMGVHADTPYQRWAIEPVAKASNPATKRQQEKKEGAQGSDADDNDDDEGGSESSGEEDEEAAHVGWLKREAASGRVEVLARLPPAAVLGLERSSCKAKVKARFRSLSRHLHPDRRQHHAQSRLLLKKQQAETLETLEKGVLGVNPQEAVLSKDAADALFQVLQKAYDAVREGGQSGASGSSAEANTLGAEVDELLFARSGPWVEELTPEKFEEQVLGGGVRNRKGAAGARIGVDNEEEDGEGGKGPKGEQAVGEGGEEEEEEGNGQAFPNNQPTTVWVVMLYSSRCAMSRMAVPLFELAAAQVTLQQQQQQQKQQQEGAVDVVVRFGGFGCGLHGPGRHEALKLGSMSAAFGDELCKQRLGMTETPQLFALLTTQPETTQLADKSSPPSAGGAPPPPPLASTASATRVLGGLGGLRMVFNQGGTNERLAERFAEFSLRAKKSAERTSLVKPLARHELLSLANLPPQPPHPPTCSSSNNSSSSHDESEGVSGGIIEEGGSSKHGGEGRASTAETKVGGALNEEETGGEGGQHEEEGACAGEEEERLKGDAATEEVAAAKLFTDQAWLVLFAPPLKTQTGDPGRKKSADGRNATAGYPGHEQEGWLEGANAELVRGTFRALVDAAAVAGAAVAGAAVAGDLQTLHFGVVFCDPSAAKTNGGERGVGSKAEGGEGGKEGKGATELTMLLDCSLEGVTWWPDVRFYPRGVSGSQAVGKAHLTSRSSSVSLLGMPFGEVRDAEISVRAATAALLASWKAAALASNRGDDDRGGEEEEEEDGTLDVYSEGEAGACGTPGGGSCPPRPPSPEQRQEQANGKGEFAELPRGDLSPELDEVSIATYSQPTGGGPAAASATASGGGGDLPLPPTVLPPPLKLGRTPKQADQTAPNPAIRHRTLVPPDTATAGTLTPRTSGGGGSGAQAMHQRGGGGTMYGGGHATGGGGVLGR